MRKILFLLVALLWVAAGVQLIQNIYPEDEEQIVQAFRQTNCLDMESRVTAAMGLDGYRTGNEQETMLRTIAGQLGVTGKCEVSMEAVSGKNVVELQRQAAKAQVVMRIVTIEEEKGEEISAKQYFKAEITLYDNPECALYYKTDLEKILASYEKDADIRLQFYGELPGSLTQKQRQDKLDELFDGISASVCRSYEDGNVYTVYAYSKSAGEYKWINGDKVNVNAAVTYDETRDSTCFYLAIPVIDGDY